MGDQLAHPCEVSTDEGGNEKRNGIVRERAAKVERVGGSKIFGTSKEDGIRYEGRIDLHAESGHVPQRKIDLQTKVRLSQSFVIKVQVR